VSFPEARSPMPVVKLPDTEYSTISFQNTGMLYYTTVNNAKNFYRNREKKIGLLINLMAFSDVLCWRVM